MNLKEYAKKRDFAKTPEPPGSGPGKPRERPSLRHPEARRLTPPLRPAARGERGPGQLGHPENAPARGRGEAAGRPDEDHPLDYAEFEGIIPEPEYGAGTVAIWDRGTYTAVETTESKRVVDIRGRKLNGRYALIRIKPRIGEKDVNWLFFKMKQEGI